jgi:hypothetical protein
VWGGEGVRVPQAAAGLVSCRALREAVREGRPLQLGSVPGRCTASSVIHMQSLSTSYTRSFSLTKAFLSSRMVAAMEEKVVTSERALVEEAAPLARVC